jgi:hypothetical protein
MIDPNLVDRLFRKQMIIGADGSMCWKAMDSVVTCPIRGTCRVDCPHISFRENKEVWCSHFGNSIGKMIQENGASS